MSNLLERAIVDAKALKEAALKNAEQLVIEKYSQEVKDAVNKLLEQEEEDEAMQDLFGDDAEAGQAETPEDPESEAEKPEEFGEDDFRTSMPDAFNTEDDEMVQIKLDSLVADIDDDEELGVFGGDDELEDGELGIDIQDEEDLDLDLDSSQDFDLSPSGGDIDIDVGGDMSPAALEEMITLADAINTIDLGKYYAILPPEGSDIRCKTEKKWSKFEFLEFTLDRLI